MNLKFLKTNLILVFTATFLFIACEKDSTDELSDDTNTGQTDDTDDTDNTGDTDDTDGTEETTITISIDDLSSLSIDENSSLNDVVGAITSTVTGSVDTPTYSIVSQSVTGVISLSGSNIVVADVAAFDYETNTSITGSIQATIGDTSSTANFTISINDVDEDTSNGGLTSFSEDFSSGTLPSNMIASNTTSTANSLISNSVTWDGWQFSTGSVQLTNTHTNLNTTAIDLESYLILPLLDLSEIAEVRVDGDIAKYTSNLGAFDVVGQLQWVYSTDCTTCDGDSTWSVVPFQGMCIDLQEVPIDGPNGTFLGTECYGYDEILNYWNELYTGDDENYDPGYDLALNTQNLINYLDSIEVDTDNIQLAIRYTARYRDNGWVTPGNTVSINSITTVAN